MNLRYPNIMHWAMIILSLIPRFAPAVDHGTGQGDLPPKFGMGPTASSLGPLPAEMPIAPENLQSRRQPGRKKRQRPADFFAVSVGHQICRQRGIRHPNRQRNGESPRFLMSGRMVRVEMGKVSFDSEKIPVTGPKREVVERKDYRGRTRISLIAPPRSAIPIASCRCRKSARTWPANLARCWRRTRISPRRPMSSF